MSGELNKQTNNKQHWKLHQVPWIVSFSCFVHGTNCEKKKKKKCLVFDVVIYKIEIIWYPRLAYKTTIFMIIHWWKWLKSNYENCLICTTPLLHCLKDFGNGKIYLVSKTFYWPVPKGENHRYFLHCFLVSVNSYY